MLNDYLLAPPSTGGYWSLDSASHLSGKRAGYKQGVPVLVITLGFIWEIHLLPGSLLDPSGSHSSSVDIFSNKQWISSMGQETSLCKWHYCNLHFQLLIFHFPSYKCFQKRRKAAARSPGTKPQNVIPRWVRKGTVLSAQGCHIMLATFLFLHFISLYWLKMISSTPFLSIADSTRLMLNEMCSTITSTTIFQGINL